MRSKTIQLVLLALSQIVLTYTCHPYGSALVILVGLFATGIPFVALLNAVAQANRFCISLAPVLSILAVTTIGAFLIGFNVSIQHLPAALLATSMVSMLSVMLVRRASPSRATTESASQSVDVAISLLSLTTTILLLSILPLTGQISNGSPFRFGPDVAYYAKMVQYYLEGGTWGSAKAAVGEYLNLGAVEFNQYCDATMSWPPLYNYRWGLTSFQCFVSILLRSHHAFETIFLSMATANVLLGIVLRNTLSTLLQGKAFSTTVISIAITLNCNLLYIWTEGFHANFLAILFFTLFVYSLVRLNEGSFLPKTETRTDTPSASPPLAPLILISVCALSMTLTYTEGVAFILIPFLGLATIVTWSLRGFHPRKVEVFAALAIAIGLLISLPSGFLKDWVPFTVRQLRDSGGNGYMQPQWANPAEILGIVDMYSNCSEALLGRKIPRSPLQILVAALFTALASARMILNWKNIPTGVRSLLITSFVITFGTYAAVSWKSPSNNYTYMKVYCFYIPVSSALLWTALRSFTTESPSRIVGLASIAFSGAIPTILTVNGMSFLWKYKKEQTMISKKEIRLHAIASSINLESALIVPKFTPTASQHKDRLRLNCIGAIVSTRWIVDSQWRNNQWFERIGDRRVFVLHDSPGLLDPKTNLSIPYKDENFVLVDTGLPLSQIRR